MYSLASIADNIVVVVCCPLVVVVVRLSLAASGTEIALLGFTAAAGARWIVGVVDCAKIAPNLATTTWYAGLVNSFMLGLRVVGARGGGRRGSGRLRDAGG